MKIYVVTSLDHFEKQAVGVYSTEKNANEAKDQAGECASVDEFEIDKMPEFLPGKMLFSVIINEGGAVSDKPEHVSSFDKKEGAKRLLKGWELILWATDPLDATRLAKERLAEGPIGITTL